MTDHAAELWGEHAMTVVTEKLVGSSLLYLAIDVGERPTMSEYSRQVNALNILWWHCVALSQVRVPTQRGEKPPDTYRIANPSAAPHQVRIELERISPLLITRTNMASPWISVLTTLAEKSAPVGYGLTALFALQRLLNMIMDWQRHRVYIRASQQNQSPNWPPQIRETNADSNLAHLIMSQAREGERAETVLATHAKAELNEHQKRAGRGSEQNYETVTFGGEEVTDSTNNLAPVLEATMINEDDPRA